jgi:uncharacterized protein YhfF
MLPRTSDTNEFWLAFRRHAGLDHANYVVGSFGDSPEMATELADLVVAKIKRATASLACDYGEDREPTPKPGDFVLMLDGEGRPRFIWRTTEVTIKPLSQVDEAFAWDEGEGDRTRNWWLAAHRRYFGRQASREGFEFDDEILTVFERFEVVWPYRGSSGNCNRQIDGLTWNVEQFRASGESLATFTARSEVLSSIRLGPTITVK